MQNQSDGQQQSELATRRTAFGLCFTFTWSRLGIALLSITLMGFAWLLDETAAKEVVLTLEYDPNSLPAIAGLGGMTNGDALREYLDTQLVVMTSHALCATAVDRVLGLPHGFSSHDKSALDEVPDQVCNRLRARRLGASLVIELQYSDTDPARATLVANAIATAYVQRALAGRATESRPLEQVVQELETHEAEAREQERALVEFSRRHDIASLEAEQALVASSLRGYSEALTENRIARIRLRAKLAQLESSVNGSPWSGEESSHLAELRSRVRHLQSEARSMKERSGGNSPQLLAVEADLRAAASQLELAVSDLVSATRRDLAAVEQQERELDRALVQVRRASGELAALQLQVSNLQRSLARSEALWDAQLRRIKKERTPLTSDGWLVRVLSPAHAKQRTQIAPVVVGLCCALGVAAFIRRSSAHDGLKA